MKMSTRGRYGIHAMYDLAQCYADGPQPLKAIALRQGVPEAYLEQLMGMLRRAGLVAGVRGAQGGYQLSRPPGEITVGSVLSAVDDDLAITDCLLDEDACEKACACPTRLLWQKVRDALTATVEGITLKDMLEDYRRMVKEQGETAT